MIFAYLTYSKKLLSLYTNPSTSALKNFKIKLIADELPTALTLYQRNPTYHNNYLCSRCYSSPETIAYLLTCIRNFALIDSAIYDILYTLWDDLNLPISNIPNFITNFKNIYITQQAPLEVIFEETLALFENLVDKQKYTPIFYYLLIKLIYEEYWILSRHIMHKSSFPTPPPFTFTSNSPLTLLSQILLLDRLQKYTLNKLLSTLLTYED